MSESDELVARYVAVWNEPDLAGGAIGTPVGHHLAVKFSWDMFAADTGEVDSIRTTFLLLRAKGMIERTTGSPKTARRR